MLDRVEALGATAIATSPYVLERCADGEGAREPPPDGEAGKVRPLDRELFGARELFVRTAPAFVHDIGALSRACATSPRRPSPLTHAQRRPARPRLRSRRAARHAVYMQVMAASPPGYRVQFSGRACARTSACMPDGRAHDARVDRNASLASAHVVAYVGGARCRDRDALSVRRRHSGSTGRSIRRTTCESALFDFNPAMTARMAERGIDPRSWRATCATWADGLRACRAPRARQAARGARARSTRPASTRCSTPQARSRRSTTPSATPRATSWRRCALRSMRVPGPAVASSRRRSRRRSPASPAFRCDELEGIADAVGIKLYTMHWPMIARYWARDLLGDAAVAAHDALTRRSPGASGSRTTSPTAPRSAIPSRTPASGRRTSASSKLARAQEAAGAVPVIAFVHSYGPLADVVRRRDIAADTGLPVWINRYGYLSDEKIGALGLTTRR